MLTRSYSNLSDKAPWSDNEQLHLKAWRKVTTKWDLNGTIQVKTGGPSTNFVLTELTLTQATVKVYGAKDGKAENQFIATLVKQRFSFLKEMATHHLSRRSDE